MSWMNLLGGMGQATGAGGNPWSVAAPQQGEQLGQAGAQNMPAMEDFMSFAPAGASQQLQGQMAQSMTAEQLAAQTPEANFGQFYTPGGYDPTMVLPDPNGPVVPNFLMEPQQMQVGSQGMAPPMDAFGQQGMQQQMPQPGQPMQPGQQQMQPQQGGSFGGLVGTPENPNIFLRLAEGYNRGGLLGSLGMGLTKM